MMPDIRQTAQAEEDLIELWLYIAQDNPGAADLLLDEIEDKCLLLTAPLRRLTPTLVGAPLPHTLLPIR
jgi:plasmid stabilization system protein ParE